MPEIISKLWRKAKSTLTNLPKDKTMGDEIVDKMANKNKGAETAHVPGLDCPQCRFRIQISIPMLLLGEPIICPSCGLKLSVDQEKSRTCLYELQKVNDAVQKVEEVKRR